MSGANLLDLPGSAERCQVTIAEDELDNIGDDPDKQRIYKMGYEDIGLVTRIVDPSSSNRDIRFYNPYCIKIFGSKKSSDSKELGGFNDRTFRSEVKKGKATLQIKEIKKHMERPFDKQLPKYRKIVSRINFLRKVSLIFRLLHHADTIEDRIDVARHQVFLAGTELKLDHRFPIVGGHFLELDLVAHSGANSFRTVVLATSWTQTSARATWRHTSLAGFPHHPV